MIDDKTLREMVSNNIDILGFAGVFGMRYHVFGLMYYSIFKSKHINFRDERHLNIHKVQKTNADNTDRRFWTYTVAYRDRFGEY
jgi:hypothetical protein